MKTSLFLLLFFYGLIIHAQVGIGTNMPESSLDIVSSNMDTPSNTDGLLIPRVNKFPTVDPSSEQNGMIVFLTTNITGFSKGFHYWDDPISSWVRIGAEEWINGTNANGDNLIYATQAQGAGTNMVITDDGKFGIGTDDPIERFELKGPGDNDFQITSASTNPPNLIFYNTGGTLAAPSALATNGEIGSIIVKTHDGSGIREVGGFRFYMDGTATPGSAPSRFIINTVPAGTTTQQQRLSIRSTGNTGLSEANPTATLHIRAGTATAGSSPLKFTAGTSLTTAEAGSMEYNGSNLFFTPASSVRKQVILGYSATASLDFPAISDNQNGDLTINVPGATLGMACSCAPRATILNGLVWNCFVSSANNVTVRVSNVRTGSIDPPATIWKVTVTD
jgi:hypothetical protein